MNAKRGSSVASSLDHLFATKVIKITDISSPHPILLYADAPAQHLLKALGESIYDGQRGYFVGSSTFTGFPSSRTNVRTSLPAVKSTASFFR